MLSHLIRAGCPADGRGLIEDKVAVEAQRLALSKIFMWAKEEGIADQEIREKITEAVNRKIAEKAANYGPEMMRLAEKSVLLQVLDQIWKEHLLALDHLRQGIGLRAPND